MTTRSQMREFGPCLNSMFWLASRARAAALPGKSLAGLTVFITLSVWIVAFTATDGSTTKTTRGRRLH